MRDEDELDKLNVDHVQVLSSLKEGSLIVIDGFSDSGKTYLGRQIQKELGIFHIDTDSYVNPEINSGSYQERISLKAFRSEIENIIRIGGSLVISGICVQDIITTIGLYFDFKIYLKKISKSRVWHNGHDMEEHINGQISDYFSVEPNRSDMSYHLKYRPHENADLIIEKVRS